MSLVKRARSAEVKCHRKNEWTLVANISRGFANIINASNIQINICKIEINNYLVQKTWKLNHCGKPHLACKLATKVVVLLLSRLPTF